MCPECNILKMVRECSNHKSLVTQKFYTRRINNAPIAHDFKTLTVISKMDLHFNLGYYNFFFVYSKTSYDRGFTVNIIQ